MMKVLTLDDFNKLTPKIFSVETSLACDLNCPECAIGGDLVTRKKGYLEI